MTTARNMGDARAKSWVLCEASGQWYFVSTIERDSSAMEGPRRYCETIVWEWSPTPKATRDDGVRWPIDGERGSIVWQGDSAYPEVTHADGVRAAMTEAWEQPPDD